MQVYNISCVTLLYIKIITLRNSSLYLFLVIFGFHDFKCTHVPAQIGVSALLHEQDKQNYFSICFEYMVEYIRFPLGKIFCIEGSPHVRKDSLS